MTAESALSLLGTVAITLDGERISTRIPAKSQALLCCLAATGQVPSRERVTPAQSTKGSYSRERDHSARRNPNVKQDSRYRSYPT